MTEPSRPLVASIQPDPREANRSLADRFAFEAEAPLLIVSPTARMLAHSAIRSGFRPVAVDAFGDLDLVSVAETKVASMADFAEQAVALAEKLPPMPWLYGGGFENEPEAIDRISRRHRLLGSCAEAVSVVRDPVNLSSVLLAADVRCPLRFSREEAVGESRRLIVKPLKSSGGRRVRFFDPSEPVSDEDEQIQEFQQGVPLGCLYLADRSACRLIGTTRPLRLAPEMLPAPFAYAGLEGPIHLEPSLESELRRIGEVLRAGSGMLGLFGVDFVLTDAGPCVIEVNPRPTASLEVLEAALGRSILAEHLAVFGISPRPRPVVATGFAAKSVVYAEASIRVPSDGFRGTSPLRDEWRHLADLPQAGTEISKGDPVVTLLEYGEHRETVRESLARRLAELRFALAGWSISLT